MARDPKKFIVPVSFIEMSYATTKHYGIANVLDVLTLWNPQLAGFPLDLVNDFDPEDFTDHGKGGMNDERLKHKTLIVLSEHDRIPPNMETDFVNEYLRPVLTLYKQPDGSFKGILKLRDLVYKGMKGHDHAPYYEKQEFEDVELVRGTLEEMTDDDYKARYQRFA